MWRGGNVLLALGAGALLILSAFAIGSFLTFGVLPFAFIGALIMTAAAFIAWNIGCKIYDVYSKKDRTSLPLSNKNKSELQRSKSVEPAYTGFEWINTKKPFIPKPGLEPPEIPMSSIPSDGTTVIYSSSEEDTPEPSITISQPDSGDHTAKPPVTDPSFTAVIIQRKRANSTPIPPTKNKSSDPANFPTERVAPKAGLLFAQQK